MRTIEEKNRMIAEFMGYETYEHTGSIAIRITEVNEFNSVDFGHVHTKFNTSWDWLMPVVEKIDKLMLDQPIDSPFEINAEEVFTSLREVNIKLTFNRIVEFIEWYNQQN